MPLGLGFVRYETAEAAISAFAELDKSYFQGRKLHIKPAEKKPPKEDGTVYKPWEKERAEGVEEQAQKAKQSDYKEKKEQILKTNFDDETNWNYLFMN